MSSPRADLTFPKGHAISSLSFPTGAFINNEFVAGEGGRTIAVEAPSTGEVVAHVAEASANDVDRAVEAAEKAYKTVWGERCPGHQRGRMLMKLAELFEEHKAELASIEALDNGKPYSMAYGGDVQMAADCLRYYGGWADKDHGKVIEIDSSKLAFTKHEPIGVVGQIIPWNFPLLMFAWKIGPALATGNTIIMKPAEITPLSALYACQLIAKVFPPGVVNVLVGYGHTVGNAISSHMKILKVAFTGSTLVGRHIMQAAAKSNLKSVTLELGGKSPNIICDDANLDDAVAWSAFGIFFNAGQICAAGSRLFVQESVYDEFLAKLTAKVKTLKVGDSFGADTFQGATTSGQQFERVSEHIQAGKDEGATVHTGGSRVGTKGYFIEPTIFTDVTPNMRIAKEEIFGPVLVVQKFKDDADLIAKANDSVYGLASAVFTRNISRAFQIANALEAGTVWINCYNQLNTQVPFGGYKQSGIGRELGEDALKNYTSVKSIHVNIDAPAPKL
ncbi:hypothetical protein JCM10207_003218 [Rhodosporidiobolus poonsookiae]